MSEFRSRTSLTIALAGALALSACGQAPAPPPAPKPAPAAPAPAQAPAPAPASAPTTPDATPAAAAVQVTGVALGSSVGADGKIATASATFSPKDTIYAVVSTTTSSPNTTIVARWTFQGGTLVKEDTQTLPAAGANTTSLRINKPDGWPVGSYALDIMLDGKSISTTPFSVK
jgi:hypothetical protein